MFKVVELEIYLLGANENIMNKYLFLMFLVPIIYSNINEYFKSFQKKKKK